MNDLAEIIAEKTVEIEEAGLFPWSYSKSIGENELDSRILCSWMPVKPADKLLEVGIGTLDWALQERYEGSVSSVSSIRARFVYLWQEYWGDRPQIGQDYWQGPKAAIGLGTRLYKFLLRYGCLKPLGIHTLQIGSGTVNCQSAIVEQSKGKYHPQQAFALDVRAIQPKMLYLPDYRGFARWLAMQIQWDSKLGLVHLPLLRGKAWQETELNRDLVERWLRSIMKQAAELPTYPVAGTHCKSCPAPCVEVFCGQNDHFRKGRLTKVSDL
jgi:hypothetical protein